MSPEAVAPTCTANRVSGNVIHRCVFAITKVMPLVGRTCQQTDPYGRCIGATEVITPSVEILNSIAAQRSWFVKTKPVPRWYGRCKGR